MNFAKLADVVTFEDLALPRDTDGVTLWHTCQREEAVLITINRNDDGPDSLEQVIRKENQSDSLPVITLANADRIRKDRADAMETAERLLEYLLDMHELRGTGRIYVP